MYFYVNMIYNRIVSLKKNSANILEEGYSISGSQGSTWAILGRARQNMMQLQAYGGKDGAGAIGRVCHHCIHSLNACAVGTDQQQ